MKQIVTDTGKEVHIVTLDDNGHILSEKFIRRIKDKPRS